MPRAGRGGWIRADEVWGRDPNHFALGNILRPIFVVYMEGRKMVSVVVTSTRNQNQSNGMLDIRIKV